MSREKQIDIIEADIKTGMRAMEISNPRVYRGLTYRPAATHLEAIGYRKQSENMVELPCKVGDTVYMPWEWNDTSGIAILTVERISITEAGQSIRTDLWSDDEDYWLAYNCGVFRFDDIGKVVFLTKEEAEQALAKMKGGVE